MPQAMSFSSAPVARFTFPNKSIVNSVEVVSSTRGLRSGGATHVVHKLALLHGTGEWRDAFPPVCGWIAQRSNVPPIDRCRPELREQRVVHDLTPEEPAEV